LYIFFGFEGGNSCKGEIYTAVKRKGGNKPVNGNRRTKSRQGRKQKYVQIRSLLDEV
jgi:hypothetical protein